MGGELHAVNHPAAMAKEVQWPLGRNRRVELLQRARGGVTRIGKYRLAFLFPFAVHQLKCIARKKHLAPDFQALGEIPFPPRRVNGIERTVFKFR